MSRIIGSSAGKAFQRDGTVCTKARRTRKNCMFYCLSRINLFSAAERYLSTSKVIGYSRSTAFTTYPSGPESQQDQPVSPWQSPPLALRFSSGLPALSPHPQSPSVMCPYPGDPHPPRLPFWHSSPSKCYNFCAFAGLSHKPSNPSRKPASCSSSIPRANRGLDLRTALEILLFNPISL